MIIERAVTGDRPTTASFPTTPPDTVHIQVEPDDAFAPAQRQGASWTGQGVRVEFSPTGVISLSAERISRVALRWRRTMPERSRVFADAWERTYADSGWSALRPERPLPWFWLLFDEETQRTQGCGVRTGPAAWCSWTVDSDGFTLWLDVRAGQRSLIPGDREIVVAELVSIDSADRPYAVRAALMEALATTAPISVGPIVGANNWYYAYGHGFDAAAVVGDARTIVELADGHPTAPFGVIDAGWGEGSGSCDGGPFTRGKGSFSDMQSVADRIRAEGARPGLWYRPLLTREHDDLAHSQRLDDGYPLDPSLPGVLDRVADDIRRFTDWGYELIKHDFSTYDMTGAFAPAFGAQLGSGSITFAGRDRTTAEITRELYGVMADAAGDAVVLGCNTVGHLAAGVFAVNRVGDDTSGKQWERTRRMGVNALASRLPQHGRFFVADADCVPATPATSWELNRRFLDLVAASGTALFVSLDPRSLNSDVQDDVAAALRVALDGGVAGGVEPLDELWTPAPRRWRVGDHEHAYDWSGPMGAEPFVHGV